jgi:short-chain fatty acids transporter
MALTTVIAHFSAPRGAAVRTAEDLGVDLDDEPSEAIRRGPVPANGWNTA